MILRVVGVDKVRIVGQIAVVVVVVLLPAKLVEFLLGADELHRAIVEQDAAALGIVVVEGEQLWPSVLIPASLSFE